MNLVIYHGYCSGPARFDYDADTKKWVHPGRKIELRKQLEDDIEVLRKKQGS